MAIIENKQPGNRDAYRIIVMLDAPHFDEIADACKKAGHEIVRVNTTVELVKFLEKKDHADLVVSAAHLENENVFEMLKSIKRTPQHAEAHIMLICTEPSPLAIALNESTEIAANALGADLYLYIPRYDRDEIVKEIEKALPSRAPAKESNPANAY
jgi:CheY-like chemotaxis protein